MRNDLLKMRLSGKGGDVPAASFATCLNHMLSILKDLDANLSEDSSPSLKWAVSDVTMNSPLTIGVYGQARSSLDNAGEVIGAFTRGMSALESGTGVVPTGFTPAALETAKKLAGFLNDGVEGIEFFDSRGGIVRITLQTAASAERLIGKPYEKYASFEGMLEVLSIHSDNIFYLYTPDGQRIRCSFPEEMLSDLKQYFGGRTVVSGTTRYNAHHRPTELRVESMRRLRTKDELPQFKDLEGIDLTGGLDSVEYVERLRSGDTANRMG